MPTLREMLANGREMLAHAGIESAALDARLLAMKATGLDHAALVAADRHMATEQEGACYAELIAARASRIPVAYLLGTREFWGRAFAVNSSVLIPRPETEHLVEAALKHLPPSRSGCILDLGTGSGALLVTLLAEHKNLWGVGVDRSQAALRTARANAEAHGVAGRAAFVAGDWAEPLEGAFDLVLANPPYLTNAELKNAQAELHAEPALALAAGADGLDAYRAIAPALPHLLKPGAVALFEIGHEQGVKVTEILRGEGFESVTVHADLSGHDRLVEARNLQQKIRN